jgi:hypothetical protein
MKNRIGDRSQGIALHSVGTVLLVLLLAGCGYQFAGGGKSTYPAIRSVFVEAITNRTSEANADTIFRSAFNTEIVQRGRFKLAPSREAADAVLRGTILNLQASPLSYRTTNLSAEDRLTVTLELSFEEIESGRVLWSNGSVSLTGDYPVSSVGATETSRRNALTKLASDTAERAYRMMMSNF